MYDIVSLRYIPLCSV